MYFQKVLVNKNIWERFTAQRTALWLTDCKNKKIKWTDFQKDYDLLLHSWILKHCMNNLDEKQCSELYSKSCNSWKQNCDSMAADFCIKKRDIPLFFIESLILRRRCYFVRNAAFWMRLRVTALFSKMLLCNFLVKLVVSLLLLFITIITFTSHY